jgi:hypothetical protein
MEYYLAIKRQQALIDTCTTWKHLKIIILSEIVLSQREAHTV